MPRDLIAHPETPPVDADGAILLRAAELIERNGWCQHAALRSDGTTCLWGAIGETQPEFWLYEQGTPIANRLGFDSIQDAWKWNDQPERTKAEVVARLRAAAYAPVPA